MYRVAIVGLLFSFGCGKNDKQKALAGRELARVPGYPSQLVRTGPYLIASINSRNTGERGRALESLLFISLENGSTQSSSELVSGELVGDTDEAYWADSDGVISRIDPSQATITPFAELGRWVEKATLNKTRLLVGVAWNGQTDNSAWRLAWVARDSGTVTPFPAPPGRKSFGITAIAVTNDDRGYVGVGHSDPILEEVYLDGTSKRSAVKDTIVAICPYPDRLITAHVVLDANNELLHWLLRVTPVNGGAPQETTLVTPDASFSCGPQNLFVVHENGISRLDGTSLVPIVSGKGKRGDAFLVDEHAVYWGELDEKGWSIRTLPLDHVSRASLQFSARG